jgi:protein-L-isoaspartate(D-aspartate) O-methyltransferase
MAARRNAMVQRQLVDRGLVDQRVLDAMGEVPRERFVPRNLRRRAYDDGPLPIAEGQTISQPFIVAAMTESAQVAPSDRALEIGTGSGYGAAVLSRVAAGVVSVERHGLLAKSAADLLASLGYDNVTVVTDDGSLGYADGAPYDVHHRHGGRTERARRPPRAAGRRRPAGDAGRAGARRPAAGAGHPTRR